MPLEGVFEVLASENHFIRPNSDVDFFKIPQHVEGGSAEDKILHGEQRDPVE